MPAPPATAGFNTVQVSIASLVVMSAPKLLPDKHDHGAAKRTPVQAQVGSRDRCKNSSGAFFAATEREVKKSMIGDGGDGA